VLRSAEAAAQKECAAEDVPAAKREEEHAAAEIRDVMHSLLDRVINQGAGNKSHEGPAEAQGERAKANVSPFHL
jgi:hypothetical protein